MRVIVAEKNKVARRIAQVLSGGRYRVRRIYRVPVYEFDGTAVIGLSGHVLNLDYPVELRSWSRVPAERLLDAEPVLVPTSRRHLMALRALFKKATEIVIATDYDREGELIGYEVIRYLAPEVPVRRAKFSSLTAEELRRAFENLVDLNEPMAKAGEARQRVDLSWGASLTRLLSVASGRRGRNFLSIGRVQTPTLALIVAREREIESHVPRPYWSLFLVSGSLRAAHVGNPFWERSEAEAAASRARVPVAEVVEHEVSERDFIAPAPYDTNTFLRDASRILGMAPHRAMRVAEDLYAQGLISYPRTDNTAYPRGTPFKRILASLREPYRDLAEEILSGPIRPRAGRKRTTDHPPIHPVSGADLDSLDPDHRRVYDLIVRRFLATLMPPARLRESRTVLDAGARGSCTAEGRSSRRGGSGPSPSTGPGRSLFPRSRWATGSPWTAWKWLRTRPSHRRGTRSRSFSGSWRSWAWGPRAPGTRSFGSSTRGSTSTGTPSGPRPSGGS